MVGLTAYERLLPRSASPRTGPSWGSLAVHLPSPATFGDALRASQAQAQARAPGPGVCAQGQGPAAAEAGSFRRLGKNGRPG